MLKSCAVLQIPQLSYGDKTIKALHRVTEGQTRYDMWSEFPMFPLENGGTESELRCLMCMCLCMCQPFPYTFNYLRTQS